MSPTAKMISLILVVLYLIGCVVIGYMKRFDVKDTEDYFLAGKRTGTVLLLLTAWASFSGAGNFIGHAGRGAMQGVYAYWMWVGEGFLGGIMIGYIMAPYLARFKYMSMAHYVTDYLCGGDLVVRRTTGFANLLPNMVWPGGQIMGLSYVIQQVFDVDFRLAVVVCGAVFIYYTVSGGLEAVIWTDAFQGVIQMILAAAILTYGLKLMNFDIVWLKTNVMAIDPEHWNAFSQSKVFIFSSGLVGFLGAISNPIFWNRAFAAKNVSTTRKAYGVTFFFNIILVLLIITVGITAFVFNQEAGDQSLVWLAINKMPAWVGVMLALGVAGATMSCADTHLNCAAANSVMDIIDPRMKLDNKQGVRLSRIATAGAGIIAILGALFAPSIYVLGLIGYTVCGGVLIPLFVIGLIMRNKKKDEFESKLSIPAARIGVISGIVASLLFELVPSLYAIFGGGIIPAVVVTTSTILVSNLFFEAKAPADAPAARYGDEYVTKNKAVS